MALYLLKYPYRKILLPLAKKMLFLNPDILGYLATVIALMTAFCYFYSTAIPKLLLISVILTLFFNNELISFFSNFVFFTNS